MCAHRPPLAHAQLTSALQPGHEYTKSNVKFALSVLQSEPVQKLKAFADAHKETQGQFTIGDEKVGQRPTRLAVSAELTPPQEHNVFMRVEVSLPVERKETLRQRQTNQLSAQDPEIQKVTGKTDPVEVMAKLREMKNNFK